MKLCFKNLPWDNKFGSKGQNVNLNCPQKSCKRGKKISPWVFASWEMPFRADRGTMRWLIPNMQWSGLKYFLWRSEHQEFTLNQWDHSYLSLPFFALLSHPCTSLCMSMDRKTKGWAASLLFPATTAPRKAFILQCRVEKEIWQRARTNARGISSHLTQWQTLPASGSPGGWEDSCPILSSLSSSCQAGTDVALDLPQMIGLLQEAPKDMDCWLTRNIIFQGGQKERCWL